MFRPLDALAWQRIERRALIRADSSSHGGGSCAARQCCIYKACILNVYAKQQCAKNAELHYCTAIFGPGWQGMSRDDVIAETRISGPVESLTELPLVGLTLGTDGTWSARFWEHIKAKKFKRHWCRSVRSVGAQLRMSFADYLAPFPNVSGNVQANRHGLGAKRTCKSGAAAAVGIIGLSSVRQSRGRNPGSDGTSKFCHH